MSELTRLAAVGGLVGWSLGSPRVGRTEFSRMTGYDPIPVRMTSSHVLDAWLVWAKHVSEGRRPEVLTRTAEESLRLSSDESAFGFLNVRRGFGSPLAGALANPRPGGSEAVLRAVFWGLAFHGDADRAVRHAYYDASMDHGGDGVWVPCGLAAAAATASPSATVSEVVEAFVSTLPTGSAVSKGLGELFASVDRPEGAREYRRRVMGLVGAVDLADAALSGLFVLLGLLHGRRDPGTSMLVTAGCGGAAAHTTGATGVLSVLLSGDLASEWVSPLGTEYLAGFGLRGVEPPATIADWAAVVGDLAAEPEMVSADALPSSFDLEGIVEGELVEGEGTAEAALEADSELVSESDSASMEAARWPVAAGVSEATRGLLTEESWVSWFEAGDLLVRVRFFDSPLVKPKFSTRLQISVTGLGDEARNVEFGLSAPTGWDVASRVAAARVDPGAGPEWAAVVQPTSADVLEAARLTLTVDGVDYLIPLVTPQPWWVAGPFNNAEGMGYERAFRPETDLNLEETMNGRSDMGVKWEKGWFEGHVYDVEPWFRSGPGVVYLYADVEFARAGTVTVMGVMGSGLKLWADGQKLMAYHDYHTPVIRPEGRYLATFQTSGRTKILAKVLRGNHPVGPLTLVFFDEDGEVVRPVRFWS